MRIDLTGVGAAYLLGDPRALARVVRNLLENAQRHAYSLVTVTLVEAPGEVVLTVGDDGPGIAPADRERVFDRFVRLDEARSADDGGAGLGLAITRAVVEAHGLGRSSSRTHRAAGPRSGSAFRGVRRSEHGGIGGRVPEGPLSGSSAPRRRRRSARSSDPMPIPIAATGTARGRCRSGRRRRRRPRPRRGSPAGGSGAVVRR